MSLPFWVESTAHFSDAKHRIWLRRYLEGSGPPVAFILHNPSVANETEDDPTLRRGIGYANRWGCSSVIFVNAATGIATDADELADMLDPIGPLADVAIHAAADLVTAEGGGLIAAWGCPKGRAWTRALMQERFEHIRSMGLDLHALRVTKSGYPEHILYLPGDLVPEPYQ